MAASAEPTPLRLGVLAFRPPPQVQAQWQPTADYLAHELRRPVQLHVHDLATLEAAVAQGRVDAVFTTPSHFIALKERYGLSAPLATQITREGTHDLTHFGGVIFTRADSDDINTLADLNGRRIAVPDLDFTGGYQMQVLELLEAGLPVPKSEQLLLTGLPLDKTVAAVLERDADVGFVRTGVLEALAREQRLDLAQVKILNPQRPDNLPVVSSTRLIPEWPMVLMPGVDAALARRFAVALMRLNADHPAAQAASIGGFSIPADYRSVESMMRRLQVSPFDSAASATLDVLWRNHAGSIIGALAALLLLMSSGTAALLVQMARVRASQTQYRAQSQRVSEILWGTDAGTWEWNVQSGDIVFNERWADMVGYTLAELQPGNIQTWMQRAHPDDLKTSSKLVERCFRRELENYRCELRLRHKDGHWIWALNRGRVVEWSPQGRPLRMSGTLTDISERKLMELGLRASEQRFRDLFENTPDPCWIIKDRQFVDCNLAAVHTLGYARREDILLHPSKLSPPTQPDGRSSAEKADAMMRTAHERGIHRFEWQHQRADGSCFPVEVTLARLHLLDSDVLYCAWRDITQRKRAEQRARHHNRVLAQLAAHTAQADVLTTIAQDVEPLLDGVRVCILLLEDSGLRLRLGAAPSLPEEFRNAIATLDLGLGTCGQAALTGQRVLATDIAQDPDWQPFRAMAARAGLGACWSQPVVSSEGRLLGTFALYHGNPCSPSSADIALLEDEARLCALVIESTTREERLQLAANVFTHAREGILIADGNANIIDVNDTFTQITGYTRAEVLGQNPRLLRSGRQDHAFYALMWQALHDVGHWSGEIWNRRKNGDIYAEALTISVVQDAQGHVHSYVALFTDITTIKEHQRQLEHFAHFDALTGLPNRVLLADRLAQAILQSQRRDHPLAVAYLDLDGFKTINDTHTHGVGDALLVALAQRMKSALRDGDTLARIGGDEFVVVLVDLTEAQDCETVLQRLLQAAAAPVEVDGMALQVSASIGVTQYPQDAGDADQLLRHADQAMYSAKLAGKNRFHYFDIARDAAVKTQHEDLARIQQALAAQEFVLYYQPKVHMKTGALAGVEALLRWRHPARGLLAPAAFLPIIENHALSVELGEWVLASALTQLQHWTADGLDLGVSVNIGAHQLQQADFAQRLTALLHAHPTVDAARLELEVLETSAMEDMAQVSRVMQACHALGVGFALDDFGTGYSSLTYLKHFPAQWLKIDQSFIRDMLDDPDDLAIVEGVIGLATAFRRNVIAEGVESAAHGDLLLTLGCDYAQGYGIARPMPAEELAAWLTQWSPYPSWLASAQRHPQPDDKTLAFVRVDQRHWLATLQAYLQGKRLTPPSLDADDSHFGRWQRREGARRWGQRKAFTDLVQQHATLFAQARNAVADLQAGTLPSADAATLQSLTRLAQTHVEGLQELLGGASMDFTI